MWVKTRAIVSEIQIDTSQLTNGWQHEQYPLWHAAGAAFLIESNQGTCIILVKRTSSYPYKDKWALIPAGAADTAHELRYPGDTVEREGREELIITRDNAPIQLFKESELLTRTMVKIIEGGQTFYSYGEITPAKEQYMFMQAYKLRPRLEEVTIRDGDHNRLIAVVKISENFRGVVMPVAMFKDNVRIRPELIDLHGYQSPTLEWWRGYKTRLSV